MTGRLSLAVLGAAFAAASFTAGGSPAAAGPNPMPTMIPLLEVKRLTSADHVFIQKAIDLAIATMETANKEISVAGTVSVQDEAVRSFNTAAAAYNGLADIAAKRDMKTAKPKASQLDDAPALAQDAQPTPEDVRYVTATQAGLERSIALYHDEIQSGKDRLAKSFASAMRPKFLHDLELVKVDIENIDHPKTVPASEPPPDPSVPASPDPTAPPSVVATSVPAPAASATP